VGPQLFGFGSVWVGAFAAREITTLAEEAFSTRDRERDDDPVADFQALVLRTDFDQFAHDLVAEHIARFHRRNDAIKVCRSEPQMGAVMDRQVGWSAVQRACR
jgi:hypothetical protein